MISNKRLDLLKNERNCEEESRRKKIDKTKRSTMRGKEKESTWKVSKGRKRNLS